MDPSLIARATRGEPFAVQRVLSFVAEPLARVGRRVSGSRVGVEEALEEALWVVADKLTAGAREPLLSAAGCAAAGPHLRPTPREAPGPGAPPRAPGAGPLSARGTPASGPISSLPPSLAGCATASPCRGTAVNAQPPQPSTESPGATSEARPLSPGLDGTTEIVVFAHVHARPVWASHRAGAIGLVERLEELDRLATFPARTTQLLLAIDALPDAERDVCVLRDIEGLTSDETAAALGLTAMHVRARVHRARATLRASMEPRSGLGRGDCPDAVALYSRRLERELGQPECLAMERHLAACASCRSACSGLATLLDTCRAIGRVPERRGLALRVTRAHGRWLASAFRA